MKKEMKELTKKERFDKVLEKLKEIKGIDIVASYYYDHKNLYEGVKNCTIDFNFLDLSIIFTNTESIVSIDHPVDHYDELLDTSIYSALCGEIGYYFNNPVIVIQVNKYTDNRTVDEIRDIYDRYFDKKGTIAYMEVCDMYGITLDYEDLAVGNEVFECEFSIKSDIDFLNLKVMNNYGEDYIRKKLIKDLTNQVYNWFKGPECPTDEYMDIITDCDISTFSAIISEKVHEMMGSNIENDKIYTEFEIIQPLLPEPTVETTVADIKKA